jgi:hypothetical protein
MRDCMACGSDGFSVSWGCASACDSLWRTNLACWGCVCKHSSSLTPQAQLAAKAERVRRSERVLQLPFLYIFVARLQYQLTMSVAICRINVKQSQR